MLPKFYLQTDTVTGRTIVSLELERAEVDTLIAVLTRTRRALRAKSPRRRTAINRAGKIPNLKPL